MLWFLGLDILPDIHPENDNTKWEKAGYWDTNFFYFFSGPVCFKIEWKGPKTGRCGVWGMSGLIGSFILSGLLLQKAVYYAPFGSLL